jgi:type VI secretion system secreted protein Hcp
MATDFYLKIDGIQGEATDEKHKNEIEIESWHMSATNLGSSGKNSGAGTGKADFSDFTVSKFTDKSTPKLLNAVGSGLHIPKIVLVCRKAGGKGGQVEHLTVEMDGVFVSGYAVSASDEHSVPRESVVFNYTKVTYSYAPQKADGSLEGKIVAGYDRALNKSV